MLEIENFNKQFAKPPNKRKKYENAIYWYLYHKYRFMTQVNFYDFYLIDYNLYIEIDEEHHFKSCNDSKNIAENDYEKMLNCIKKPASLLRISWFSVINNTFDRLIKKSIKWCKSGKCKIFVPNEETYANHKMFQSLDMNQIIWI